MNSLGLLARRMRRALVGAAAAALVVGAASLPSLPAAAQPAPPVVIITPVPLPDLTVSAGYNLRTHRDEVRVSNIGGGPTGPYALGIEIHVRPGPGSNTAGATYIHYIGALAPGQSRVIPVEARCGDTFTVVADFRNAVAETNENNNKGAYSATCLRALSHGPGLPRDATVVPAPGGPRLNLPTPTPTPPRR